MGATGTNDFPIVWTCPDTADRNAPEVTD